MQYIIFMLTFGSPNFEIVQLRQVDGGVFETLTVRVSRGDKRQEL